MKRKGIGVFDSGLGGLTVVRELQKYLPNEKIIYFGDTARVPYGNKSRDTIIKYSREIVNFLKKQDVKLIVIACNTASAFALEIMEKELNIPIIGVIKAGSRAAVKTSVNRRVGVIGTRGTIKSQAYFNEIKRIKDDIEVAEKECPLLVPLIEEGMLDDIVTLDMSKRYIDEIKSEIDTLVLGCTHYPLIKDSIKKIIKSDISLIDSAEETALEVKEILENIKLLNDEEFDESEFYVSDMPEKFQEMGSMFLGKDILKVEKVNIEH